MQINLVQFLNIQNAICHFFLSMLILLLHGKIIDLMQNILKIYNYKIKMIDYTQIFRSRNNMD